MRPPRILPKFLAWADEIDDAGRISDQNHLEAALGSPWLPGRSGYRKIEEFCAAMGAGGEIVRSRGRFCVGEA